MSLLSVLKWYRVLSPIVRPIVGEVVKAIAKSDDPKAAAIRALREVAHEQAAEAAIRRILG